MTDTPPEGWSAPPEDAGSEKISRPSSIETHETLENFQEVELHKDHAAQSKDKGIDTNGEKGIARMPELPPEIRETILYLIDPETFASLVLVDHAWRQASQTPHLYAHHLSRCPSYSRSHSIIGGPFTDDSLPLLKRQFAWEVKRNLFEAYLQPRRTLVSLISTTTTSSAAFPGGEAFDFAFSPNGHWVLGLSSSRIYVIDTVSPKVSVQRELKVLRRPVSAAILDDGSTLAVLSCDQEVNIYTLANLEVHHLRSVTLDNPPHIIALAPKGEVLAAAFDGGIEVHSLTSNTLETDHRAIKCDRVDALRFSNDGTMLLGTTKNSKYPNTVVLSAPYYTDDHLDLPASDQISHLWTSQILFPNTSRDCSNATLLPHRSDGEANWTFTYDRVFESFRAVRTNDLRNGTTYFTGPKHPNRNVPKSMRKKLTPCTLPSSSDCGELVAAGFLGREVWLYGIPEGLDSSNVSQSDEAGSESSSSARPSTPRSGLGTPRRSFTRGEAAELAGLPKWQVLVDKHHNAFAKGRQIAEIPGVSGMCWVKRRHGLQRPYSLAERLVIAAPGGISGDAELEQEGLATVDGGRLVILDFDRATTDGTTEELRFEVGDNAPELLEEFSRDMDTEVALARRRTVKRELRPGATVADVLASAPPMPPMPSVAPTANAIANATSSTARDYITHAQGSSIPQGSENANGSPGEGLSLDEASEAYGGSYSHTQPRSRSSLYRSATAVAANRQRNPNAPRIIEQAEVRYRRPGDRTELPHESDADNWVPPPPAYTPNADRPLPEELRMTLLPRNIEPVTRERFRNDRPRRASTLHENTPGITDERRSSPLLERPSMSTRQRSAEAATPNQQSRRSVSDAFPSGSDTVSPLSAVGSPFGEERGNSSTIGRRPSTAGSSTRPMSAFVGSITSSLRRPSVSRLTSPISPERRPQTSHSISLPPSPTRNESPSSPITLTGANLQQRLEYPLPPAPTNSSVESLHRRHNIPNETPLPARNPEPSAYQEMNAIAASMPSAQQLINLNNRSRQPPPAPARRQPSSISSPSGYPLPAPPRGALGAAGNQVRPASRFLSSTQRNSFARSSPALLRPTTRRLDTIESVSSFISRVRSRSKSRDLHTAGSGNARRSSHSIGPALVLDRVQTDGREREGKRSFFSRKGKREKGRRRGDEGDEGGMVGTEKGGKCAVM
ncbi:hypothetical protein ACLMJK_008660 [Lecanora helva]